MYVSTDSSDEPLLKSNMFSLGGSKFFGAVNRSINLGKSDRPLPCVYHFSSAMERLRPADFVGFFGMVQGVRAPLLCVCSSLFFLLKFLPLRTGRLEKR